MLDRRPRQRLEVPVYYEWRLRLNAMFDELRRRSGISEEKAHEVLLVLYDYQENRAIYNRELYRLLGENNDGAAATNFSVESAQHNADLLREANMRIAELLSPDEMRAWRHSKMAAAWYMLGQHQLIHPRGHLP